MKNILIKCLTFFARLIIKKYKPIIIGITGSVGKTSSKEAIVTVLKDLFPVRASQGNYNNELGVPLTIIGEKTGGRSLFRWLKVFLKAIFLLIFPLRYPKVLILEMGADKPGDIDYLVKNFPPSIAVVTAVGPTHLEFFGTIQKVALEKSKIIQVLPKDGLAILNIDDEMVKQMKEKTKARVVTLGFSEEADVQALELREHLESKFLKNEFLGGTNFKIKYQGDIVPIFLPNLLGKQAAYAALVGAAVGLNFNLNLIYISEQFRNFEPLPGRMHLIPGIKQTIIIDDSYNSSPKAALAALEVLKNIKPEISGRCIAVLGDMLELGAYTEEGHRQVGKAAASVVDYLIGVGERAYFILDEAKKSGLSSEKTFFYHSSDEAGHFLQSLIKSGDVILIKGSRKMKMEKIVQEIMAEPLQASKLLVH